jgi:YHS domain-containing protein
MLRAILFLVIAIFLITVVRMFMGVIMKGMAEMMNAPTAGGRPPAAPVGGELKRDPVCGTFVPANTAYQRTLKGDTHYFCSAECRDKYIG